MKIFITGATGYIGRVVVEKALSDGHTVRGLSRNSDGDARLKALGATPVRGELTSLDVLRQESAQADMVLQLAYIHDFGMNYEELLRIDAAAVDALAEPLRGTDTPFVITSGTAVTEPDPAGGETAEDAAISFSFPLADRIRSERYALRLWESGVRVSALRLPPYVYGRGGSFFLPMLIQAAAKAGESIYIDDGAMRSSAVHVDDAAALFLLAAEKAKAGEVFNGTGSTTITLKELAETIGEGLKVPVRSVSYEEAEGVWGKFFAAIVGFQNRASNRKAVEELGWQPKGLDMLSDVREGSYRELVEKLRKV
ncbi:hypothetical protein MMC20_000568 [Loxospora ochrophaea]|nr:hypothetical protein [Loxospora ochrophaea]